MMADMQRARLIAGELPKFGWEAEILTPEAGFQTDFSRLQGEGLQFPEVPVHEVAQWQAEFFAREFPFVDDLGRLNDVALRQEAATWFVFLHPLFCFARGASTKLATGLAWGLPCITTESGMRGYELPENAVSIAGYAAAFACKAAGTSCADMSLLAPVKCWSLACSARSLGVSFNPI
jgi:hypothetical protein